MKLNSLSDLIKIYMDLTGENENYSVLNTDNYDQRRFNELLNMSEHLSNLSSIEEPPMFKELLGDIWASFYKMNPELLSKEDLHKSLHSNYNFIEHVMNDQFYHKHKKNTELHDMFSLIGTMEMGEKVIEWFQEQLEQNEQMKEQMKEMKNVLQEMKNNNFNENSQSDNNTSNNGSELNNQQGDAGKDNTDKDFKQEDLQGSDDKLNNIMEQFADSMQDALNKEGSNLEESLNNAMEEAKDINDNLENLLGGHSKGSGDSVLEKIPLREKIKMADILKKNKKIKEVAKWTGRFKAIARKKRKNKTTEQGLKRGGVVLGNELHRLLPREILNLEENEADFKYRFQKRRLNQFGRKGKSNMGQGSIIFIIDQSGSMSNLDDQSKGFGLALMSIAKRQRRNFVYIPFSNEVGEVRKFSKGRIEPSEMTDLATDFMSGGTEFTLPLEKSLEILKKDKYKHADIVFVTDGRANVPTTFLDEFNKEKNKMNFSVLSLIIGMGDTKMVQCFSDRLIKINSLNEEGAFEVFEI